MSAASRSWPEMPEEVQQTLRMYLGQLRKKIGDQLEGVLLYGSLARGEYVPDRSNINLLIIVRSFSLDIGQQCGTLFRRWGKAGVVAPLLMTENDLRHSLNFFPLEYFEIKYHHVLLEGRDPFPELHINEIHLRSQCQQELTGNLFRLRQRFVEGEGRAEAIQALLPISLTALLPCVRGLLRLHGYSTSGTAAATLGSMATTLQVDSTVFQEVLNLKRGLSSPGRNELPRLFERYLQALERLISRVQELDVGEGI